MAEKIRAFVLAVVAFCLLTGALPATAAPVPDDGCIRPRVAMAAPYGRTSCPGVRPGGLLLIPSLGFGCTMGFIYSDAYGRSYMVTAGHCAAPEIGTDGEPLPFQKTWKEGYGPVVTTSTGKAFGRFVFAAFKGNYDIAVILISKGVKPTASMCHFGGPTTYTSSRTRDIVTLEHYGNSLAIGDALPARTGWTSGMPDPWTVAAVMPSFKGDSGGPVVTSTGKAVGLVTHISAEAWIGYPPYGGVIFVTRLGPQLSYAQKYLGKSLKLRTAPHSSSALF